MGRSMPSFLTRTLVATRSAGGNGVPTGVGSGVTIGGIVISGDGVGMSAKDGSGEVAVGSALTGTEYVRSPADRIVTPNAVSSAGTMRVRICSVGPAIGAAS